MDDSDWPGAPFQIKMYVCMYVCMYEMDDSDWPGAPFQIKIQRSNLYVCMYVCMRDGRLRLARCSFPNQDSEKQLFVGAMCHPCQPSHHRALILFLFFALHTFFFFSNLWSAMSWLRRFCVTYATLIDGCTWLTPASWLPPMKAMIDSAAVRAIDILIDCSQ
jgi:hypothetical protein